GLFFEGLRAWPLGPDDLKPSNSPTSNNHPRAAIILPMLRAGHDRTISYLRISVTERCNFRCVYCMPAEGIALAPKADLLTFEEITRVARVGASLGLTKIRLTGGEPTVRADLPVLVRMLSGISGIGEISMTTNASLLD